MWKASYLYRANAMSALFNASDQGMDQGKIPVELLFLTTCTVLGLHFLNMCLFTQAKT